jgi:hypothetical protein
MIRYSISRKKLEKRIEQQCPGWLADAKSRTAKFKKSKKYDEKKSIWSKVKTVYMKLQGNAKCAYCERMLEPEQYGKVESDVEHFRPKRTVSKWSSACPAVAITPTSSKMNGYYLLAYHPLNYALACKPCNSALKANAFPIAKKYRVSGADPATLTRSEKPFLIYPIGCVDVDPEKVITFNGANPVPVFKHGHKRDRALINIEFFALDDVYGRSNLAHNRKFLIMALYAQLKISKMGPSPGERAIASGVVRAFTQSAAPHANCMRSFCRLYGSDPVEAKAVYDKICKQVATKS